MQSTKEKIVRQSLKRIEKRLEKIETLISENPFSTLLELRLKAAEIAKQYRDDHKNFNKLFEPLIKEERRLKDVIKKQQGTKLWDEQGRLLIEQNELINELYYIEQKK